MAESKKKIIILGMGFAGALAAITVSTQFRRVRHATQAPGLHLSRPSMNQRKVYIRIQNA
jgi:hypothetical protein